MKKTIPGVEVEVNAECQWGQKKAEGKCKPEFLDKRIQLADKKLYFVQCFNSKQLEKLCHIFIITYSAP